MNCLQICTKVKPLWQFWKSVCNDRSVSVKTQWSMPYHMSSAVSCEISNTSSVEVCQSQRCYWANHFVMSSSLLIDLVPSLWNLLHNTPSQTGNITWLNSFLWRTHNLENERHLFHWCNTNLASCVTKGSVILKYPNFGPPMSWVLQHYILNIRWATHKLSNYALLRPTIMSTYLIFDLLNLPHTINCKPKMKWWCISCSLGLKCWG